MRRIVQCSGKVYYDRHEKRIEDDVVDVAVVRVEQLYPFPADWYTSILERYGNAREVVWCQEEPQNQGAWYQIRHRLQESLNTNQSLLYAGRGGAAAPAAGVYPLHAAQQQAPGEAALRGSATETTHRDTHRLRAATTKAEAGRKSRTAKRPAGKKKSGATRKPRTARKKS